MSAVGTAVALDLAPAADRAGVERHLHRWAAWRAVLDGGWTRYTLTGADIDLDDDVRALLVIAGTGCAAVAEDGLEHGARWVVLAARPGELRTVHRRSILDADPADPLAVRRALRGVVPDPRVHDVTGAAAAREAAAMFGVDPGPVVAAEAAADRAFEGFGTALGPFPWWPALGLARPGPDAGEPLSPP